MNSALLVIDVQRGLFDDAPRPWQADEVVQRINDLTMRARAADVPVFFIQHERERGNLAFGTASWDLEQSLQVESQDRKIRKTTPDSFLRTPLEENLKELGVKKIVVCGYATEFCVDTTTRRAAAQGYEVVIAADAHTTHDKVHASAEQIRTHHNATLPDIGSFGPEITAVPSAEIRFGA